MWTNTIIPLAERINQLQGGCVRNNGEGMSACGTCRMWYILVISSLTYFCFTTIHPYLQQCRCEILYSSNLSHYRAVQTSVAGRTLCDSEGWLGNSKWPDWLDLGLAFPRIWASAQTQISEHNSFIQSPTLYFIYMPIQSGKIVSKKKKVTTALTKAHHWPKTPYSMETNESYN
jgi:hypothetical protein